MPPPLDQYRSAYQFAMDPSRNPIAPEITGPDATAGAGAVEELDRVGGMPGLGNLLPNQDVRSAQLAAPAQYDMAAMKAANEKQALAAGLSHIPATFTRLAASQGKSPDMSSPYAAYLAKIGEGEQQRTELQHGTDQDRVKMLNAYLGSRADVIKEQAQKSATSDAYDEQKQDDRKVGLDKANTAAGARKDAARTAAEAKVASARIVAEAARARIFNSPGAEGKKRADLHAVDLNTQTLDALKELEGEIGKPETADLGSALHNWSSANAPAAVAGAVDSVAGKLSTFDRSGALARVHQHIARMAASAGDQARVAMFKNIEANLPNGTMSDDLKRTKMAENYDMIHSDLESLLNQHPEFTGRTGGAAKPADLSKKHGSVRKPAPASPDDPIFGR